MIAYMANNLAIPFVIAGVVAYFWLRDRVWMCRAMLQVKRGLRRRTRRNP